MESSKGKKFLIIQIVTLNYINAEAYKSILLIPVYPVPSIPHIADIQIFVDKWTTCNQY